MHIRLPADTRAFRPGVFKRLELFRRHLAAVNAAELGRTRVGNGGPQMGPNRHREDIPYFAFLGLEPHRADQNQVVENFGVGGNHLCCNKSAGGERNHVHRVEPHFSDRHAVQAGQVTEIPNPLQTGSFAKTRLERNHERAVCRHLIIPFHPSGESQLIMQH